MQPSGWMSGSQRPANCREQRLPMRLRNRGGCTSTGRGNSSEAVIRQEPFEAWLREQLRDVQIDLSEVQCSRRAGTRPPGG
jgi:hypothetical protein